MLGAALLVTVAAAVLVRAPEEGAELAPQRGPRIATEAAGRTGAAAREEPVAASAPNLEREEYAAEIENLFPARSWRPPPPPLPPAAVIAAPPSAPPLPFQYLGMLQEGDRTVVFLSQQERTHMVRQGDTLNGVYRVERITADNMVFVYLPLKQKQTLQLGKIN